MTLIPGKILPWLSAWVVWEDFKSPHKPVLLRQAYCGGKPQTDASIVEIVVHHFRHYKYRVCLKIGYFSRIGGKSSQTSFLGMKVARFSCVLYCLFVCVWVLITTFYKGATLLQWGFPDGLLFTSFFIFPPFLFFSFPSPTLLLGYQIAQAGLELSVTKNDL